MMTQKLTKAEEEVMIALWEIGEGVVRDVLSRMKDPGTPYTTVSTVIRVLEKKGFIGHRAVGNTYLYYPLISKERYLKDFIPGILSKYFNGSFTELASFFARENKLTTEDLSELIDAVSEELKENASSKND
ncbi:MAG: BlaI/MecI/CopY family transcriptional regulator [Bacteroidota bacterium]